MIRLCSFKGRAGKNQGQCVHPVHIDGVCLRHYNAISAQKEKRAAYDRDHNLKSLRLQLQQQEERIIQLQQQQQQLRTLSVSSWLRDSVRKQQDSLSRGLAGNPCSAVGGTPYNAVTTLAKMQTEGFDLHQRLHATGGFLILQGAFDPDIVDCAAVMDRVAFLADGAFEDIVNDEFFTAHSQRAQLPPAPLPAKQTSAVQKDTNLRTRNIVDDAER